MEKVAEEIEWTQNAPPDDQYYWLWAPEYDEPPWIYSRKDAHPGAWASWFWRSKEPITPPKPPTLNKNTQKESIV